MILYLDTSSNYLYSGIINDDKLICEIKLNLNKDLSTYCVDKLDSMFKNNNISVNDIEKIIVCSGPGSFTGIRVGMSIAKIYAYCLNKNISTIISLEAMKESVISNLVKVPIIDARRGYVYAAAYKDDSVIISPCYIKLEDLKSKLNGLKYEFISNDNFDFLCTKYDPDILRIVNKYKNNPLINPHFVEPTYFKLTEAEENKNKGE